MTSRNTAARLLLAVIILATSLAAIRYYDGHDFINNIWAPIHGLVAGLDPYDPAAEAYFFRYRVPVSAGLYLPAALLLNVPLALLSPTRSAEVMAILNVALLWSAVLLLIPPRTSRACLIAAIAGTLVVASASAQDTINLGQLSGWAVAGLALIIVSLQRDPSVVWLPALGAVLVSLKPQSAIPMLVALGALGYWRILSRAIGVLTLASLPGGLLFLRAAGGVSTAFRVVRSNMNLLVTLPPVDLANPHNLRTDALGVVSHLHGPALTGPVWILVELCFMTLLFVLAVRAINIVKKLVSGGGVALAEPYVVMLVATYILASLYHLMYDQLPLYVGPLAAFGQMARGETMGVRSRAVAVGGVALALAGLVFRAGMRARWVAFGLPELAVRQAWVTVPTLIGVTVVIWGLHQNGSGPTRKPGRQPS